jgi:hypothetical protein
MVLNTNLGGVGKGNSVKNEYEEGRSQYGSEEEEDNGNYAMRDIDEDYGAEGQYEMNE